MRRLVPIVLLFCGIVQAAPVLETDFTSNFAVGSSVELTKPAGVTTGDLLVLLVCTENSGQPTPWDALTGWDLESNPGGDANPPGVSLGIYTRIADGTEGATVSPDHGTVTHDTGGFYARISGAAASTNLDAIGTLLTGNGTSHVVPSVNATVGDSLAFYFLCFDGGDGDPFSVAGTGWAESAEAATGGSSEIATTFGIKSQASSGATGDATVTSSVSDGSVAIQFVVAPAAGGSGVYDTAPTVTAQSTTAYTVTGSLDAAGTVDGVACLKDQTAPTIAQVQAGTCTGDVAAEATDTDSPSTGDFDFSLTLTPTDAFPKYDVYVTDGTTLTTLADEELGPPSTCGDDSDELCQFVDITSIGTGSPLEDFNTAADPDIASPDILVAPVAVSPGITGTHDGSGDAATLSDSTASWADDVFIGSIVNNDTDGSLCTITDNTATTQVCTLTGGTDDDWDVGDAYTIEPALTISAAGQFSYPGDGTQQRAFNIAIYDVSAEGYHAEDIDFLVNNTGPTCSAGDNRTQILEIDVAIETFDLDDAICDDPDAEQLTYTLESTGTHTGSANAATLTESTANFVVDGLIGLSIDNDTDGSSCTITDNDATTVTCTLSGGSENDWDTNDAYTITYVLPTGLSLNGANGEVTGTPTVEDEGGIIVAFTATDIGQETDTAEFTYYVIDTVTMPDITGDTVSEANTTVLASFPWVENLTIVTTFSCHESVVADDIISQSPVASAEVESFSSFLSISATVSTGECPTNTEDDALVTVFISSAVPANAAFIGGTAYAPTGRYVADCTPPAVAYVAGLAHRNDGALCIVTGANPTFDINGWGVTSDGEVTADTCVAVHYANGVPRGSNGRVCMTDIN